MTNSYLFIHPALLVERYSNSVWNSEVSWSANTFEDHGRWKFFAIGGNCECDCKAPLLGAARLHWNCSAATEWVLLDGSSNRIGVSSILNSLESEWPYRCRSAITNRWNWMVFSPRSCGSRWARVVLVRRLMEWRFFHLWYQPSEALKSGSLLNSFAFSRRINPLTAIPVKDKRDQLFDLFLQHEKLANQKQSFPRFV